MRKFINPIKEEVTEFRADSSEEVKDIVLDDDNTAPSTFSIKFTWGLSAMRVMEAWNYYPANYYGGIHYESSSARNMKVGKGIVVAGIDTGVNGNHESLKGNHRIYAGWLDAYDMSSTTPFDDNGHGTHTMGTICGSNGIGNL